MAGGGSSKWAAGPTSMAGAIAGTTTYFVCIKSFVMAAYVAAPVLLMFALAIAHVFLHRRGLIRLRASGWRVTFVFILAVMGYFLVAAAFDGMSALSDRWMPTGWSGVSSFIALLLTGLLAAPLAWIVTAMLTDRPDRLILLLFIFASAVSAIASSLASTVALGSMDADYRIVLLLFPGVLFAVGMTLFGGVFGYALARAGRQRNIQAQEEDARQLVLNP